MKSFTSIVRSQVSRENVHDQMFIDKWFMTNSSRRMVRVMIGVRVRFRG